MPTPHHHPVALVTGASRGIGRAIALELSKLNFEIVVNYATNRAAADEVLSEIQTAGGSALAVCADIANAAAREELLTTTLANYGRIDLLVNNAGIASPGRHDLLELTVESYETVLATNLQGPFFLTQHVAREMLSLIAAGTISGGKIINISSVSAYAASVNRGDYCLSKAGMSMMTALFAERLAGERIGVFEIRPGIIRTDMTAEVQAKYDRLIAEGLTPIPRWGTPDDVARAVAAIALDYFPFSTGEVFNVDGGFHLRRL